VNRHLNDRELLAYWEGIAPPRRRERAEAHLCTCSACRARLERLARTAANLSGTLQAVGEQIPVEPDRSWEAVAQRLRRQRSRSRASLFYKRLRHLATLAVLALLVVGLAGLIHTLAVTGPALTRSTPTPWPIPPASPSSAPEPLPRPYSNRPAIPTSVLILGTDGEADAADIDPDAADRGRSESTLAASVHAPSKASDETDLLMLLYLDAEAERAFLLSIPRNLYVEVPGGEQVYASSIYRLGEQDEGTNGLALAQEVMSATLGLPIQHTALVRFDSFVALVDAIGGVDVEVSHPIEDLTFPDGRGGHDPLFIPAGRQHLDGVLALQYARTRVVPAPGFDRTFRQQQLILAAHERVTRLDLLRDLIAQAPTLWSAVADGLDTDLLLNDVIDLALSATELTADDITAISLDECCVVPHTPPGDKLGLLPQQDSIEALMENLLEEEQ
jgi:LCP family protein required for cell wall assembly